MKKILVVDSDKCVNCGTCSLACSSNHYDEFTPGKAAILPIPIRKINYNIPTVCMHCAEPLCVDVCPVQAISKDLETGTVTTDTSKCIGCRMCTVVCPVGAISINADTQKTIKCDLCGGDPVCVQVCGYGAIKFVSIHDGAIDLRKKGIDKMYKALESN